MAGVIVSSGRKLSSAHIRRAGSPQATYDRAALSQAPDHRMVHHHRVRPAPALILFDLS